MPYAMPSRFSGSLVRHYWSEQAHERTDFLTELVERLGDENVPATVHEGWTSDDLTVFPHGWTSHSVRTVQEDHSGGRRLLRVRIETVANAQMTWALGGGAALAVVALVSPASVAVLGALALFGLGVVAWRVGADRRLRLVALADQAAEAVGLLSMQPAAEAPAEVSLDGVLDGLRAPQRSPQLEAAVS